MKERAAGVLNGMGATGTDSVDRRRGARRATVALAGVVVLALATGLVVRIRSNATTTAGAHADVAIKDGDLIRYTRAFAVRAGVTTARAQVVVMSPDVRASGAVTFDPQRFAAVGARSAGRIRHVRKLVGDKVAAGEILAEVESPELARADARLVAARAKEKTAEAQLRRERRLVEDRVEARVVELAAAALEAARVERIAAEQAVKALGGEGQGTELGILFLRSPLAGRVVSAKLARGHSVAPTDTVYEVADLDSLWVELDVFERDLESLRVGDSVKILPRANASEAALQGKVAHVGDVIDRDSRTASIRVGVDNRAGLLRAGQSVTARIETSAPARKVVSVPVEAVTRVDGQATLLVAVDDTTARIREVSTGPEDARRVAVLEGLRDGERVLVGGVSALTSELLR